MKNYNQKLKTILIFLTIFFGILGFARDSFTAANARNMIFSDGFESGNLNNWDAGSGSTVATTSAHSGTYCMRLDYFTEGGFHGNIHYLSSPPTSELYLKYFIKFAPTYHVPWFGMKYLRLRDGVQNIQAEHYFNSESFYANGHTYQGNPTQTFDVWYSGHNALYMADGNWHKIEVYVKYNTGGTNWKADGIHQVWFDGVIVKNKTDAVFRDDTWPDAIFTRVYIPSNAGDGVHHAAEGDIFYVDDVEIWDGIPSSDTTPPAAPTGVTVN
jgi:hypothetical protein